MSLSPEMLLTEAERTGFRPEMLEKAVHLLRLLEALFRHPFLKRRLALKGGTALSLFLFDLPRLSIDLDLNYVGSPHLATMQAERPRIESAVRAVCERAGCSVRRAGGDEHAGGKWALRYQSAWGTGGNLSLDMNYMLRVPLWPTARRTSHPIGPTRATAIPVVDVHELTAGKLCALLTRQAGRDLFDAHLLLTQGNLDEDRLRLAFVVYGGMSRRDWRTVSTEDLSFEEEELNSTLVPLLRRTDSGPAADLSSWATSLVGECRALLSRILPFTDAEREFLNRLLDQGHVEPSFLTRDEELAERIRQQPMLKWKALHVRQFKGKSA